MKKIVNLFLLSASMNCFAVPATILVFDETEPKNEPGISRMIITDNLLRIDDGNDKSGFILYDTQTKVISSVSHEERSTFEIKRPKNKPITKKNDFRHTIEEDKKAPKIANNPIWQVDFYNGMKRCGTANTVKGLFTKELAVLKDYYQTMQLDSKVNIDKTPEEFLTGCFINNYVNHVTDYYDYGFPIAIKREDGFSRLLQGFQTKDVDKSWLEVPANYNSYSISLEQM